MPTSDSVVPTNSTLPMLTKKQRMSYDEKLNASRKLFNHSRKRVENLKKNQSAKRFRNIEKPADDAWITGGRLGSRDAVLVFRTRILKTRSKEQFLTVRNSQPEILAKELDSVDRVNSFGSADDNQNSKSDPKMVSSWSQRQPYLRAPNSFKLSALSSKAHLPELSSSDNSISSGTDDPQDEDTSGKSSNAHKVGISSVREKESGKASLESNFPNEAGEDQSANVEDNDDEDLIEDAADCCFSDDMPALQLKISYKFMQTETKLLRKIFIRHGLSEVEEDENFSILWTGIHMKPDILRNLAPYQRVNHFPRSYELTRKDRLYKNIERMQHLRGHRYFDIVPQSFVLPLEYKDLVGAHNKHRGPWIVKPAASSRGRGIFIVNTPDQIPQDEQVLVSKYVADPLCIDGHKCDLRVYVLVTSFDPLMIYLYQEGIVRLATVKYERSADSLWNPCMHLCNYSINKYHSDYIKSSHAHDEDVGHKWTLSALLRHLKTQGCDTRQLMLNIEDLIIKSILACAQSVISACRMFVPNGNNCFELYGFDILIDDTLKPWLLEVNLSPSMGVDSPLDAKVKATMIADLLTCVGIPAYSATMRTYYDSKWTRFRNINCSRRTNSAEPVGNNNSATGTRRSSGNLKSTLPPLTIEEMRIIRNARMQNVRRGGFVRIFPTEDTMQRYGTFLDPATGIPMSTYVAQGQIYYSMILPHNYNQMLFNNLYGSEYRGHGVNEENSEAERINQYERVLEASSPILFAKKRTEPKCEEEGKRLRKQIMKLIDNGSELTQLQARQTFALYLESILRRLTQDPKDHHEKLILKFLNRVGGTVKAPVLFRNPQNFRIISKARSAMIAKLLGDFLEQYNRDTEAYVDAFDHFGMIPTSIYREFLSHAQEADLEAVLTLHTNLTGNMPYLYNRCGLSVPSTPPIPSGVHGFLRALPAMVVSGSGARDFNKCDGYYKSYEKEIAGYKSEKLPDIANGKNIFMKR